MSNALWSGRFKEDLCVAYQDEQGTWVREKYHKGQWIGGELVELDGWNLFLHGTLGFNKDTFDSVTIRYSRAGPC